MNKTEKCLYAKDNLVSQWEYEVLNIWAQEALYNINEDSPLESPGLQLFLVNHPLFEGVSIVRDNCLFLNNACFSNLSLIEYLDAFYEENTPENVISAEDQRQTNLPQLKEIFKEHLVNIIKQPINNLPFLNSEVNILEQLNNVGIQYATTEAKSSLLKFHNVLKQENSQTQKFIKTIQDPQWSASSTHNKEVLKELDELLTMFAEKSSTVYIDNYSEREFLNPNIQKIIWALEEKSKPVSISHDKFLQKFKKDYILNYPGTATKNLSILSNSILIHSYLIRDMLTQDDNIPFNKASILLSGSTEFEELSLNAKKGFLGLLNGILLNKNCWGDKLSLQKTYVENVLNQVYNEPDLINYNNLSQIIQFTKKNYKRWNEAEVDSVLDTLKILISKKQNELPHDMAVIEELLQEDYDNRMSRELLPVFEACVNKNILIESLVNNSSKTPDMMETVIKEKKKNTNKI